MAWRDTKRSEYFRIREYFNNAKTKIHPLKSGSDYSCLLMHNTVLASCVLYVFCQLVRKEFEELSIKLENVN